MEPNVNDGIEYWNTQPATYNGVLGGYGTGSLPRVDALGSRLFLLHLVPDLSTVPSALQRINRPPDTKRFRALDVGAGVGRVTCDVLLHLVQDVVLLEPVTQFIQEALNRARASAHDPLMSLQTRWRGLADRTKSVTFVQSTLQSFDPRIIDTSSETLLDRIGNIPSDGLYADLGSGFDVVWCQWCLGHLSDADLAAFLRRSHGSLRGSSGIILIKENVCSDGPDGEARSSFDEQDSSLTRSDQAWKAVFQGAGLTLVEEKVQEGLPAELYVVKMYALR